MNNPKALAAAIEISADDEKVVDKIRDLARVMVEETLLVEVTQGEAAAFLNRAVSFSNHEGAQVIGELATYVKARLSFLVGYESSPVLYVGLSGNNTRAALNECEVRTAAEIAKVYKADGFEQNRMIGTREFLRFCWK